MGWTPRAARAAVAAVAACALGVAYDFAGAPERAHAAAPIRLALASLAPEGTPWGDSLQAIKARIEKESEGRIKVVLFLGGRRGTDRDAIEEMRAGKLQGAAIVAGNLAAEVPELELLELPFLFRDSGEADLAVAEVMDAVVRRRLDERGLVLYAWSENGWRSVGSRAKPIRSPDDLAGMKVRAQETDLNVAFWRSLGAAPVGVPTHEVLAALAAGTIEGFDQTPVYTAAAGWQGQIKSYTLTEHTYQPALVVFTKRFIDGLPEDLREVVLRDGAEVGRANREKVRALSAELSRDLGPGVSIIRPTPEERERFRERTAKVYEPYRSGALGPLLARIEAAVRARRAREGR
jgi:TRAP-type C4-dicarboxylate transport system substrate-binding protein